VRAPSEPARAGTKSRTKSARGAIFLVTFLLAILLGGGVGGYLRVRARERAKASAGSAAHGGSGSAAAVVDAEVADEVVPPPAPPEQREITVSIQTDPAGVKVVVGGVDRGVTPVDVKLPRGTAAVDVQLLEPGFASAAQQVVPDRDQRLYFQLIKQQKTIVRVRPTGKPKDKDRGSGFRRFD
jgi:hypothetical protein